VIVGAGVAVVAGAAGFAWFTVAAPHPTAGAGSGTSSPGTSGGSRTELAAVATIPENGGVILPDQKVVLTRETGDKVHCFSAVCTHQGCLVSQVAAGKIGCPCHGSTFDANTGAVVNGPAPSPLAAVPVTVVNGTVYSG
jgi:Rieske Fe-S protein